MNDYNDNDNIVIKSIQIRPTVPLFTSNRRSKVNNKPKTAVYMARPYTPSTTTNRAKLTFDKTLMSINSLASPIHVDTISPSRRRPMTVCTSPNECNVGRSIKKINKVVDMRLKNIEKEQWSSVDKVKNALIKAKRIKHNENKLLLHSTVISQHSKAFHNPVQWGKDCFVHDLYEPRRQEIFKGRAVWQSFCADPMMSPSLGFIQR